jgi:hypothetical protein
MRGDEWTAQLRQVVGDELFTVPGVMNRVVALSAGIEQHYDVAPDAAPPVGSIAGDTELAAGGRLADHAHDGRFVLVDRSPDGRLAAAVPPLERRVAYVADPASDPARPSLLVRPDGIIAWAGPQDTEGSGDGPGEQLAAATGRWIGTSPEHLRLALAPAQRRSRQRGWISPIGPKPSCGVSM